MSSKIVIFSLLVTVAIITVACGGAPKAEIQAAVQEQFNYYGEIPIVSAKKASYPENAITFAPGQEVWCVVIDATFVPYNRGGWGVPDMPSMQSIDRIHLFVNKRGLLYESSFALVESEYARIGCNNW